MTIVFHFIILWRFTKDFIFTKIKGKILNSRMKIMAVRSRQLLITFYVIHIYLLCPLVFHTSFLVIFVEGR